MKHHITSQGILFSILMFCSIFIIVADVCKIRYSRSYAAACEKAGGTIVTEFVCVKPGSIFDPTIGDSK